LLVEAQRDRKIGKRQNHSHQTDFRTPAQISAKKVGGKNRRLREGDECDGGERGEALERTSTTETRGSRRLKLKGSYEAPKRGARAGKTGTEKREGGEVHNSGPPVSQRTQKKRRYLAQRKVRAIEQYLGASKEDEAE